MKTANVTSDEIAANLHLRDLPCIARPVSFGVLADGTPFLATALIEGVVLREHASVIDGAELDKIEAEAIEVLSEIHRRGIAHGDLNSDNILIGARLVLLDFGCANFRRERFDLDVDHLRRTFRILRDERAEAGAA